MAEDQQLRNLSGALLRLHKTLLDVERADYEKVFGRLNSGELLQLVVNDAQFAWLRVISELVVQIDELLSREEPATANEIQELLAQARLLFDSPPHGDFMTRYQAALQREPNVVLAHSEVMKLLRGDNQT